MSVARRYWLFSTIGIALFSLFPLLLPQFDTWDFAVTEMGFLRHDYSYFAGFKECHQVRYLILLFLDKLSLLGISPKIAMNILSILCLLGLSYQIYIFLSQRYKFSFEASLVGAWVILAFPVWHTLVSGAVFSYILFLFLFMSAVNQWWRKHYIRAGIMLLLSLSYYSLFAFAVGFAASEFVLTANKENYKKKIVQCALFSSVLLAGYIALENAVNIHEVSGTYNTFSLSLLSSFVIYGIVSVLVLAGGYLLQKKLPVGYFRNNFMRYLLSFLILGLFAVLAYWAVGKSMRYFSFGSYGSRHTYLTCIPFALIVTLLMETGTRLWGQKRPINLIVGFLVVILIVLQHQGYSHKAAELIYREIIAQEMAKQVEPESGYVAIVPVGAKAPRHIHSVGLSRALFRVFGKTAWMLNDPWRRSLEPTPQALQKLYAKQDPRGRIFNLTDQVTGDAYTRYELHLKDYYQEGRFWYWWYYVAKDFRAFNPELVVVEKIPSLSKAQI